MNKPYDSTTKDLLELGPEDWVAFLGRPDAHPVRIIDADLTTVSAQADKVLAIGEPVEWLLHIEFQASRDDFLPQRLLQYNTLLRARHRLPAAGAVVLLRPQADSPLIRGELLQADPLDGREHRFPYSVVRVWEQSPERFMTGGLGLVPFARIAKVVEGDLPGLTDRIAQRLRAEADADRAKQLAISAHILLGLRFADAVSDALSLRVEHMEESVTYQAILNKGVLIGEQRGEQRGVQIGEQRGVQIGEQRGVQIGEQRGAERGRLVEARNLLLALGETRFQAPDPAKRSKIEAMTDREQLEALCKRVLVATSWDDLLADVME